MNTFASRSKLRVNGQEYEIYRLDALEKHGFPPHRLPYSMRILLENLLRAENGRSVTADDIRFLADWKPQAVPDKEIAFTPARVLMQDFTGVPAVVDLGAMRDAMKKMGGDPRLINPLQPAELVIDHSVQVDEFATVGAFATNAQFEFVRNKERYAFLRWGQSAFRNFKVVPPDMGIVHQVNLEYLAGVVGKFVEFFGPGLPTLALADRATIANMAPEYGATCGIFPVDEVTLSFLRMTGRKAEQIALVEAYCKEQGMFHTAQTPDAEYSQVVELDLSTVEPSVAGPRRPQDRAPLSQAKESFEQALPTLIGPRPAKEARKVAPAQVERFEGEGGSPIAIADDPNVPAAHKDLGEDV